MKFFYLTVHENLVRPKKVIHLTGGLKINFYFILFYYLIFTLSIANNHYNYHFHLSSELSYTGYKPNIV